MSVRWIGGSSFQGWPVNIERSEGSAFTLFRALLSLLIPHDKNSEYCYDAWFSSTIWHLEVSVILLSRSLNQYQQVK